MDFEEALRDLYRGQGGVLQPLDRSKIHKLLHGTTLLKTFCESLNALNQSAQIDCLKVFNSYLDDIPEVLVRELLTSSPVETCNLNAFFKNASYVSAAVIDVFFQVVDKLPFDLQKELFEPTQECPLLCVPFADCQDQLGKIILSYLRQLERIYPEKFRELLLQLLTSDEEPSLLSKVTASSRYCYEALEVFSEKYGEKFPEVRILLKPIIAKGKKEALFALLEAGKTGSFRERLRLLDRSVSSDELTNLVTLDGDEMTRIFGESSDTPRRYIGCISRYPEITQTVATEGLFFDYCLEKGSMAAMSVYLLMLNVHPDKTLIDMTANKLLELPGAALFKFWSAFVSKFPEVVEFFFCAIGDPLLAIRLILFHSLQSGVKVDQRGFSRCRSETQKMPEAPPQISLNTLLNLFDQINFTHQDKPAYLDPDKLKMDGKSVTRKQLRSYLARYIKIVTNRTFHTGSPPAGHKAELEKFYGEIENALKNCIVLLQECGDAEVVAAYIRDFAVAGAFCAGRYRSEAYEIYDVLMARKDPDSNQLDGLLREVVVRYKRRIFQGMVREFQTRLGISQAYEGHFYTTCAKVLGGELGVNDNGMSNFSDPFGLGRRVRARRVEMQNYFYSLVSPQSLIEDFFEIAVEKIDSTSLEHYFRNWFCEHAVKKGKSADPWTALAHEFYLKNKEDVGEILGDCEEDLEKNTEACSWFGKRLRARESSGIKQQFLNWTEGLLTRQSGYQSAVEWLQGHRPDLIRSLIKEDDIRGFVQQLSRKELTEIYGRLMIAPGLKRKLKMDSDDVGHLRTLYLNPDYYVPYLMLEKYTEEEAVEFDISKKIRSLLVSAYIKKLPKSVISDSDFKKQIRKKLEDVMLQELAVRFLYEVVLDGKQKLRPEFVPIFFFDTNLLKV